MPVIYTAICGGFDAARSDIQCFTDPGPFAHPRWSAKRYKILSHLWIADTVSIWVDGNIRCLASEQEIIAEFLPGDANVGCFRHPYRKNPIEEAFYIAEISYDTINNMSGFVCGIGQAALTALPLCECGVLVRRNTAEVATMNCAWWSLICRFSIRDQLTFPIAVQSPGIRLNVVESNVREHPMFKFTPHEKAVS
jgi:hypothetical protein